MSVSIARNSFARLLSDGSHLLFAFISGIITARVFQPEGKGAYAALLSLVSLSSTVASLGLGDASVILIGKGEATLRRIFSVTLIPVAISSCLAAGIVIFVARSQLGDQGPTLGRAVLAAGLCVPAVAFFYVWSFFMNARERIVETSLLRGGVHLANLLILVVLVILLQLHITGGMLAFGAAFSLGAVAIAFPLRRMGVSLRPVWDKALLIRSLRLGLVIEFANALLTLAARIDVLFVYALAGRASAGRYSVALTMGQLVTFVSLALSFALFPRIAQMTEEQGVDMVARASRLGLATSILSALVLLVAIPILTPIAFGPAYSPSIGPALLLLVGGTLWAQQSLMARARTALGHTRLQLYAYGSTLVVMIVLDLLLIPLWGIMGAAAASTFSPAVGLAICVAAYRPRLRQSNLGLRDFLPGKEELVVLWAFLRHLGHRATFQR